MLGRGDGLPEAVDVGPRVSFLAKRGLTRPIPHDAPVVGAPRKVFAKKKTSIASVASGPFASV